MQKENLQDVYDTTTFYSRVFKYKYYSRDNLMIYHIQNLTKQVLMQHTIKKEESQMVAPIKKVQQTKERIGRWSTAEAYLFESLLQRYGKNWKQIQKHMKNRTLSQIRSHGQKYFGKISAKKIQEFQRRAKLLQAYETLENQKLPGDNASASEKRQEITPQEAAKQEDQSLLTRLESNVRPVEQPIIKEQATQQNKGQIPMVLTPIEIRPCFHYTSSTPMLKVDIC